MRRLARELNVTPGALYWHFANKQQLLGAVADRILEPATRDGRRPHVAATRIAAICRALRDALLSHTDGAELVSASFAAGKSAGDRRDPRPADRRRGRGRHRRRQRRAGRPHGGLLRAGLHRRRAVPAAVGRRGRAARRAVGAGRRIPTAASPSGCDCWSTACRRSASGDRHCSGDQGARPWRRRPSAAARRTVPTMSVDADHLERRGAGRRGASRAAQRDVRRPPPGSRVRRTALAAGAARRSRRPTRAGQQFRRRHDQPHQRQAAVRRTPSAHR